MKIKFGKKINFTNPINNKMNIKEIQKSKINSIDFDKLAFGQTFTDHMLICHYREGKWQTPTWQMCYANCTCGINCIVR